jgi:hypothetical protein
MADHFKSSKGFVAVHTTEGHPGNLMYILLDDRATFDLIDLPEGGNDKVRHKAIEVREQQQHIVFQYWLPKSGEDRP